MNSCPISVARRSAFALSSSVTTRMRPDQFRHVGIRESNARSRPTERHPCPPAPRCDRRSRASAAAWSDSCRSAGSRYSDITGLISPRIVRSTRVSRSSARSTTSVCGNSLYRMMMSASRTRLTVRWQCGSSSTPITQSRPDDRAHPLDHVAFHVVVAVRNHGAVQPEQHAVERHRGLAPGRGFRRA